jgi:hypothetical protein
MEACEDAFDEACGSMHDEEFDWREEGVTSRMVEWVCRREDVALTILWKGHVILATQGRGKCIYCIAGDHCYFLAQKLSNVRESVPRGIPAEVLAQDIRRERKQVEHKYLERLEQLAPGDWWTEESLEDVREALHRNGVVPTARLLGDVKICELHSAAAGEGDCEDPRLPKLPRGMPNLLPRLRGGYGEKLRIRR